MSNPQDSGSTERNDVDDVVDSANEGLAEAAAAGAEVPGVSSVTDVDPDLAAFEEAERSHPGTFSWQQSAEYAAEQHEADQKAAAEHSSAAPSAFGSFDAKDADATRVHDTNADADTSVAAEAATASDQVAADTSASASAAGDAPTSVLPNDAATSVMGAPYTPPRADDGETRVLDAAQRTAADDFAGGLAQPIFVQAPEPPRDRGNRGTAGIVGFLAAIIFGALYLGVQLLVGLVAGDVTFDGVVEAIIAQATSLAFWVPVVIFFIGFWLLGSFINRGRWGNWVVFGLFVGVIAWAGHLAGVLVAEQFWTLTASEVTETLSAHLFSPLAIGAFIIGRELTIWFGAWVAKRGARKNELNAAARAEYDRTIEAGPTLPD